MLNARIKQYGIEKVFEAIENIRKSSFLQGQNSKSWTITFDWFVKPNNFPKVLEGNYADKANAQNGNPAGERRSFSEIAAAIDRDEEQSIIEVFGVAAKRYDCRVFLVDNLMTADYGKVTESDYYRQQSRFVGQLVDFAGRHNVHVHLVAHPRKEPGRLSSDSVSGSGDITNRVANVISVERKDDAADGCNVVLDVKKNRWEGSLGAVKLSYCAKSHRIYASEAGDKARYGWENGGGMVEIDIAGGEDLPF